MKILAPLPPPLANRLINFLDRTFVWIPNERKPGLAAVVLFILRITILPWFFIVALALVVAKVFPTPSAALSLHGLSKTALGLAIVGGIFGSITLVEELSRYGFVRHAERQLRAMVLFTVVTSLGLAALSHKYPYAAIWRIALEVAASAVLYYGARNRINYFLLVSINIIFHVALIIVNPLTVA